MPIPPTVDFDRVVAIALEEIGIAMRDWLTGAPLDEVALMNHLTGRLNRRRRSCDVGNVIPVRMESRLAALHRQGPKQTDRYGCDLAVTVSVPADAFLKTACFQLKKSSGYQVSVERRQLEDSLVDPRVGDRAFVLAADELRGGVRLESVARVLRNFPANQATRQYNCAEWHSVAEWLNGWLSCTVGPESRPGDLLSVEELLRAYTLPEPRELPEEIAFVGRDELAAPARAWLSLTFRDGRR